MVSRLLSRTNFTTSEARALTALVEEFVNAQAELDKSLWRDHCMKVFGERWKQEWRQRTHETA